MLLFTRAPAAEGAAPDTHLERLRIAPKFPGTRYKSIHANKNNLEQEYRGCAKPAPAPSFAAGPGAGLPLL